MLQPLLTLCLVKACCICIQLASMIRQAYVSLLDCRLSAFLPADVLKFFGIELGAQTKYDKKTGTCIVNGAHDPGKLSELLESFIKK